MGRAATLTDDHRTALTQTVETVVERLGSRIGGLTSAEAVARRLRDGPNSLTERGVGWLHLATRQLTAPLTGLLVLAGMISFILNRSTDGLTIVGIMLLNGLLGFVQEYRSSRAVRVLREYLSTTTTVRRQEQALAVRRDDLVVGDIVILHAGDAVPADLRLSASHDLAIDESTLTGESRTIPKITRPLSADQANIGDPTNLALAGTLVRNGEGEGIVIATGGRSVLGSMAALVATTERPSAFEQRLRTFSAFLVKVVAVALGLVIAVNLFTRGAGFNLAEELLFALALAVSVIPEALPAVTTVMLSRGALALAKRQVVVKRLSAIEDLGRIEVLCTDTTGTLTENRPAVARLIGSDQPALLQALLASIPPTIRTGARPPDDPFDQALLEYAHDRGHRIPTNDLLDQAPFDPERRRSSVLVREGSSHRLIVKGTPENVLANCRLEPDARQAMLDRTARLGAAGEQLIAVGVRPASPEDRGHLVEHERDLTFLGCITWIDPIKPSSRRAILDAERLGVAVKIVTGDSPSVAGTVAAKLGLVQRPHDVTTGDALERLSPAEYRQAAQTYRVFARMTPPQKLKLMESLASVTTVAFLGQGFDDAPALRLASVSLAVHGASDAAREAADIVLLDQSLHVIIDGIREGRTIFVNLLTYVRYTLIGNFGNFFALAGISLTIPYLPMLPAQILLTNLLTDFPLVAIAGDRVDAVEVRKPQTFNLRQLGFLTLLFGLVSSLFDFIFFGTFRGQSPAVVQTLWFIMSVGTELLVIYSIRTRLPIGRSVTAAPTLIWLTLLAGVATFILPVTSFGHRVFHLITPSFIQLGIIAVIVLGYVAVTEFVKRLFYSQYRAPSFLT